MNKNWRAASDIRTLVRENTSLRETAKALVEALKTWEKFFDSMPKGQFGNISCDVGLMNDGFILTRAALELARKEGL